MCRRLAERGGGGKSVLMVGVSGDEVVVRERDLVSVLSVCGVCGTKIVFAGAVTCCDRCSVDWYHPISFAVILETVAGCSVALVRESHRESFLT